MQQGLLLVGLEFCYAPLPDVRSLGGRLNLGVAGRYGMLEVTGTLGAGYVNLALENGTHWSGFDLNLTLGGNAHLTRNFFVGTRLSIGTLRFNQPSAACNADVGCGTSPPSSASAFTATALAGVSF
jgi:hypothetical protein